MLFNSWQFLIFLPIVFSLYYLVPSRFKHIVLLVASCIFYMFATPLYIFVIFLSITIDFLSARIICTTRNKRKRKLFLLISIFANVLLLGFFKYFNFLTGNISLALRLLHIVLPLPTLSLILPIGLSFHTFQGMSYVFEVYKKKFKPEKKFLTYALYVLFFPQLVAGPIERPTQLLVQLRKTKIFSNTLATEGMRLMLWGMLKKVAVADRIGVFVDPIFSNPSSASGISIMIATILFAYQIYYDFSGYTDIARGVAKLFGYSLELNFNNPYSALSVQEFWRRWHMTLSSWFRDYVYIPLGGNRKSFLHTNINVLITFLLCGLWHGANWTFVLWGGLNACYLILENIWKRLTGGARLLNRTIATLWTFSLLCFGWLIFRASSLQDIVIMLRKLIFDFYQTSLHSELFLNQNMWEFLIVVALLICIEFVQYNIPLLQRYLRYPLAIRWAGYAAIIWIIILSGDFGKHTFIYFRF